MKVLVTGAAGFIGRELVEQLLRDGVAGRPVAQLVAADLDFADPHEDLRVEQRCGSLADPAFCAGLTGESLDAVFHLASVPGGAAEADYMLGRRVNLDATLALFEALADARKPPVVVYASSIAVYGSALPDVVTPGTPLRPPLTYGAHKLACEILLADFSRRGLLDGRSVRLPGIVARPRTPSGLASAFMSDLLHALRAGERFTCPVSPQATAWWMSAPRCAENLVHAAAMDVSHADPARAWPLPVLRLSIAQVVETCAALYGENRRQLVQFDPQPRLEAVFGRYPLLDDASSRALGLRDDGSAEELIRRSVNCGTKRPTTRPAR